MDGILMFLAIIFYYSKIVCIGLGFIPAGIARTKGYRLFGLWWLFGWLAFIPCMITVLVLKDKSKEQKRCPDCGKIMRQNANFCESCGNKMPVIKTCPQCGARAKASDKVCMSCGNKFIK